MHSNEDTAQSISEKMKAKIKDIARVQMGYSFRSRLEATTSGNISIIQMKDLAQDNIVDCSSLTKIDSKNIKNHHYAKKDDLVFRSRGHITTSAIIRNKPEKTIIASPLIRIRITQPAKVLPEYLNWYIGQRDAQIYLASRAKGTVQKMISKQAVEDLEFSLPSLKKQKMIVTIALLSTQEQNILQKLAEKRKQFIATVLMQSAKGNQA